VNEKGGKKNIRDVEDKMVKQMAKGKNKAGKRDKI
jgi:hypothetical protein